MPTDGAAGTAAAARNGHLCMGGEMCGVRKWGGSAVLIALW